MTHKIGGGTFQQINPLLNRQYKLVQKQWGRHFFNSTLAELIGWLLFIADAIASLQLASKLWPQSYGLKAMALKLWPQSYGLKAMALKVWPQSYGLKAMAKKPWPQSNNLQVSSKFENYSHF